MAAMTKTLPIIVANTISPKKIVVGMTKSKLLTWGPNTTGVDISSTSKDTVVPLYPTRTDSEAVKFVSIII